MNSIIKNALIGAATLAIAAAPLAASAQNWQNGQQHADHQRMEQRDAHYYNAHHPYYHRYNEGYYGVAPGGWYGYYHAGRWYHHRRFQNGITIYL